jgi:glucose-6-phosphate 1-dehydrogenase
MAEGVGTLIILGASGDLTQRLLLPALGQLLTQQDTRRVNLIGAGSAQWTDAQWRDVVTKSFATVDATSDAVAAMLASTTYVTADVTDADALQALFDKADGVPALYFALPPAVAKAVCQTLSGMTAPHGLRLALEKPFGTDEKSAEELNTLVLSIVPENQIHRIDHFLGNSTVQNLFGLRFANRIFEPLWSAEHIARVDIVYDEMLGLEGRAGYYDHAGALVDMLQSHLLQVLAVTAMEPPSTMSAADLRDAKGLVLRATRVWDDDPTAASRRARYAAGTVQGRALPSYVDEQGVDPARETETLAELTLAIDTWRWAGVPFTIRSGKALATPRHEIVITFKDAQCVPSGLRGVSEPDRLRMRLGPDEFTLELNTNGPGDPSTLSREIVTAQFGNGRLSAYGEVLADLLDGDPSLSVRGDTAVECWRIVTPVLAAWREDRVPLDEYPAGSEGPASWPALP